MLKINNKRNAGFWVRIYAIAVMGCLCILMTLIFQKQFEYNQICFFLVGVATVFFLKLFLELKYIEVENSNEVFSIKHYNPVTGKLQNQIEIPVSKIKSASVVRTSKNLKLRIHSTHYNKEIMVNAKLKYINRQALSEIEQSLSDSIAGK